MQRSRRFARACAAVCFTSFILLPSAFASAAPTAEDIFKSMDGRSTGGGGAAVLPALGLVAAGVAVLVLLAWLSRRTQRRAVGGGTRNHPAKLLREVSKAVGLKRAEVRQLKLLADACAAETGEPTSALTLLLCPSVLAKAVAKNPAKIDRQVLAGIVRQLSRSTV